MPGGGNGSGSLSAEERVLRVYEQAESETARAFERMVSTESFGRILATGAENVAALSRIGADLADLVLRNLRIASRADVIRLARALHRTEDKLERVLQEVEALRDELGSRSEPGGRAGSGGRSETGGRAGSGGRSEPGKRVPAARR